MSRHTRKRIYGRGLGGIFRGIYKFFKLLFNFLIPTLSKAASSKTGQKLIKQAKKSALKRPNQKIIIERNFINSFIKTNYSFCYYNYNFILYSPLIYIIDMFIQ